MHVVQIYIQAKHLYTNNKIIKRIIKKPTILVVVPLFSWELDLRLEVMLTVPMGMLTSSHPLAVSKHE